MLEEFETRHNSERSQLNQTGVSKSKEEGCGAANSASTLLGTLIAKGFPKTKLSTGLKILAVGDLTKKVVVEATGISKNAIKKLEANKIEFKLV